jgi:hypothetical protein
MRLLEGRAERLNNLIKISAPQNIICKEIVLILEAAKLISPSTFKSWSIHEEHAVGSATG